MSVDQYWQQQYQEKILFLLKLGYVDEIFNTFIDARLNKKLKAAKRELEAMTPAPMNTMLQKQPREEAIALWQKRKAMVVQEVPSTAQGTFKLMILHYSKGKHSGYTKFLCLKYNTLIS